MNTHATPAKGNQELNRFRAAEAALAARANLRLAASYLRRAAEQAYQSADLYARAGNLEQELLERDRSRKLDAAADEALAGSRPQA